MPVISWNEIRARAAQFAAEWKDAHYEKGETQSFYNDFFHVFGRRRRDVAVYEEKVKKLNDKSGFIDLFWPGYLLVEQKSVGRSLEDARKQATDYYLLLTEKERPRYILLSDFQTFELLDLEDNEEYRFTLTELPENVRHFHFIAGYQQQKYRDQDPVNIEASELMSNLHKRLEDSGYKGHDLEQLLVRIMFCLFADDTGIFQPDSFLRYIEDRTSEDGSDLGPLLIHLFEILDTPEDKRQSTLDEDLNAFPYVDGELFREAIRTPSFNSSMRDALLMCCYFNWSRVSPALFGSLFQTVMLPVEQRQGGAHYTSERNILKVIHPLFMDELREEFERIRTDKSTQKRSRLEKFHDKISKLTFFDPACGCGNFLILSYRELRLLEIEVLEEIYPPKERQTVLDIKGLSKIDVDQFYGIEIEEFPVRIAEAAMWLVDHQMNMKLSEAFGQAFVRLPLQKSAHILQGNALKIKWSDVLQPNECNYILGNPPFVGKSYQTYEQKQDMAEVFIGVKNAGVLDYVTAWYWKAAQFIQGTNISVAYVSTNSITQGEQVGVLWQPLIKNYGIRINFAHRTFKWTIDEKKTRGMNIAAVHAVIIGFAVHESQIKRLFEYETVVSNPHQVKVKNINPYLIDGDNIFITKRRSPICDTAVMLYGSKPVDGGNLVLTDEENDELITKEPLVSKWLRKYMGADEFLYGYNRWCVWLENAQPSELKKCPLLLQRIAKVKEFRLSSKKIATHNQAQTPTLFAEIRQPKSNYLVVPEVSSENRTYIPIGYLDSSIVASNRLYTVSEASVYHFGIITSIMHMAWMRITCGRLESRYLYSSSLCYNNFPWPDSSDKQKEIITHKAQAVLDAREQFPDSSLADLYDPNTMPPILYKAHQELDKAVDKAYRDAAFKSEKERMEFLLDLYQKITEPLIPKKKKQRRKTA